MYKIISTPESSEEAEKLSFSLMNENGLLCDISNDENVAQNFADLLNKYDVDEEHVFDVIEDFFYSWGG